MTKKKIARRPPVATTKPAPPAFPAKELERWFRSEIGQLTDTVRGLQKDIERLLPTPSKPVTRSHVTRVRRKVTARHPRRPASVGTPK